MGQTTQLRIDIGTQVPSSKSDMRNKGTGFRNSIIFLLPKQRLAPKLFLPKQIEIWFVTLPFTSFYCIRGWERKQKRFAMSLVSGIKYTPIKKKTTFPSSTTEFSAPQQRKKDDRTKPIRRRKKRPSHWLPQCSQLQDHNFQERYVPQNPNHPPGHSNKRPGGV